MLDALLLTVAIAVTRQRRRERYKTSRTMRRVALHAPPSRGNNNKQSR